MDAYASETPERQTAIVEIHQLVEDARTLWAEQRYAESDTPLVTALDLAETRLGADDPWTAVVLSQLGFLRRVQGEFDLSSQAFDRSLAIRESRLGSTHNETIQILIELAALHLDAGDYERSEAYYRRAVAAHESIGRDDGASAKMIADLAWLLYFVGRYSEAEPLYLRALASQERLLGVEHPETAETACKLAIMYDQHAGFTGDPESLYRQAAQAESAAGFDQPSAPERVYRLADFLRRQGRMEEAKPLFDQAIRCLMEQGRTATDRSGWMLGGCLQFLHDTGREEEAEKIEANLPQVNAYTQMLRDAVAHQERTLGANSLDVAESLVSLARSLLINQEFDEAEALLTRALKIREMSLTSDDPLVAELVVMLARFPQYRETFANTVKENEKIKQHRRARRSETEEFDAFTRPWLDDRRPALIRTYLNAILDDEDDETGAVMAITSLTFMADLEEQWGLILELIDEAPDDDRVLQTLAAGPVEGMLGKFNEDAIDRVVATASLNPKFRRVLTGVWKHGMSDEVWAKVRAIQAGVPDPLPEARPFSQPD